MVDNHFIIKRMPSIIYLLFSEVRSTVYGVQCSSMSWFIQTVFLTGREKKKGLSNTLERGLRINALIIVRSVSHQDTPCHPLHCLPDSLTRWRGRNKSTESWPGSPQIRGNLHTNTPEILPQVGWFRTIRWLDFFHPWFHLGELAPDCGIVRKSITIATIKTNNGIILTSAGMWIQHTFAEADFRISPGLTSFLLLFPFLNGLLDPFSTLQGMKRMQGASMAWCSKWCSRV